MIRKILIYGDLDLNVIDGSSIWLVNLAKLLLEDKSNYVDILLKKRIRNHILVREIEKRYRIRLLYVKDYIDHITEVDSGNIVKVLQTIDGLRDYSCMIIRGTRVMEQTAGSDIIQKVIPYLTDFCHDKAQMPEEQKRFLKDLYRKVQAYFVQTEAMKEYLKDVLGVDGRKFHVLYPVVFPGKTQEKQPETIVYAGKIAKNWNILELLDIMERLEKEDPRIRLHFIGNKVNLDLADRKNRYTYRLQNAGNIIYHGAQPHSETERITKECSLGYAFRSAEVDHDHSLEVSVKLLEYCHSGRPGPAQKNPDAYGHPGKGLSAFCGIGRRMCGEDPGRIPRSGAVGAGEVLSGPVGGKVQCGEDLFFGQRSACGISDEEDAAACKRPRSEVPERSVPVF